MGYIYFGHRRQLISMFKWILCDVQQSIYALHTCDWFWILITKYFGYSIFFIETIFLYAGRKTFCLATWFTEKMELLCHSPLLDRHTICKWFRNRGMPFCNSVISYKFMLWYLLYTCWHISSLCSFSRFRWVYNHQKESPQLEKY